MTGNYCPYEIDSAAESFGLETISLDTRYGPLPVRVSRDRQSETATMYIHGVGADWTTWSPLLQAEDALASPAHDRILVNLPGFGDAPNKLGKLDIRDVGDLFLSVAGSLGYRRLRLVGHSMGGFLTLDMASRHSEGIESIHLVAGPYFSILDSIQHPIGSFKRSPTTAAVFGAQYLLAHTGAFETTAFDLLYRLGLFRLLLFPFSRYPMRLRSSVVHALCHQANPQGLLMTAANGPGYDAYDQWAKITCPIWATFGEQDKLVPQRDMLRLTQVQPNARCSTIPNAGHMLHIEWPIEVSRSLHLWAGPEGATSNDRTGNDLADA